MELQGWGCWLGRKQDKWDHRLQMVRVAEECAWKAWDKPSGSWNGAQGQDPVSRRATSKCPSFCGFSIGRVIAIGAWTILTGLDMPFGFFWPSLTLCNTQTHPSLPWQNGAGSRPLSTFQKCFEDQIKEKLNLPEDRVQGIKKVCREGLGRPELPEVFTGLQEGQSRPGASLARAPGLESVACLDNAAQALALLFREFAEMQSLRPPWDSTSIGLEEFCFVFCLCVCFLNWMYIPRIQEVPELGWEAFYIFIFATL